MACAVCAASAGQENPEPGRRLTLNPDCSILSQRCVPSPSQANETVAPPARKPLASERQRATWPLPLEGAASARTATINSAPSHPTEVAVLPRAAVSTSGRRPEATDPVRCLTPDAP